MELKTKKPEDRPDYVRDEHAKQAVEQRKSPPAENVRAPGLTLPSNLKAEDAKNLFQNVTKDVLTNNERTFYGLDKNGKQIDYNAPQKPITVDDIRAHLPGAERSKETGQAPTTGEAQPTGFGVVNDQKYNDYLKGQNPTIITKPDGTQMNEYGQPVKKEPEIKSFEDLRKNMDGQQEREREFQKSQNPTIITKPDGTQMNEYGQPVKKEPEIKSFDDLRKNMDGQQERERKFLESQNPTISVKLGKEGEIPGLTFDDKGNPVGKQVSIETVGRDLQHLNREIPNETGQTQGATENPELKQPVDKTAESPVIPQEIQDYMRKHPTPSGAIEGTTGLEHPATAEGAPAQKEDENAREAREGIIATTVQDNNKVVSLGGNEAITDTLLDQVTAKNGTIVSYEENGVRHQFAMNLDLKHKLEATMWDADKSPGGRKAILETLSHATAEELADLKNARGDQVENQIATIAKNHGI